MFFDPKLRYHCTVNRLEALYSEECLAMNRKGLTKKLKENLDLKKSLTRSRKETGNTEDDTTNNV